MRDIDRIGSAELLGRKIADVDAEGAVVFDAAPVAALLGLPPEGLMAGLRDNLVFQIHEMGTGDDLGNTRVTFRHRSREVVLILDAAGHVLGVH
ncbi:DUF6522 family protein [Azospirillum soli]|uniref:DUF6522 family protein n=1 Tax=Azospirillum soli TaxID=1304799 RepID=UPI001AE15792|nr:DUF6522 family protein [Azospirillum soli]MBP2316342.1 hypothetical protein [Azospirillum soli]